MATSTAAAGRARTSPELGSGAREEAGTGAKRRAPHREHEEWLGEAGGSSGAANLKVVSSAAGGEDSRLASSTKAPGSNQRCRAT